MTHPRPSPWRSPAGRLSLLLALVLALSVTAAPSALATHGGLHVTDLTDASLDAADLAQSLVGAGVTIDSASVDFIGDDRAGGTFSGGTGIIGFDEGIILSSGQATDVVGPNDDSSTTTALNTPGDPELTTLAEVDTYDAALLEFDFEVGNAEEVTFQYVFGSEEYNEYVEGGVNDVFAFWVNGTNCALVGDPAVPVSIDTINNGQTGVAPTNPDLYVNNDPYSPDSTGTTVPQSELLDTEMDGMTVVLTCTAAVTTGTNTMRMGIADGGDSVWDSWVLIQAASLTTGPEPGAIDGTVTDATTGDPIAGATVSAGGASTTTAPDGTYLLSDLPPGDYTVSASATGYVADSQSATATEATTTTVDFALQPVAGPEPGAIDGTVTDATTGDPIAGATVSAGGASTTTAPDGTYLLSDLPPGDYTVSASATGYVADSQSATVTEATTTTVDFVLQPVAVDPGGDCVDLLAGQHSVAGEVCVADDGTTLTVTYTTVDGWGITETHLHVADDVAGVPQNKQGNPKVGHFAHAGVHDPAVSEVTYTIPLSSLGATTGDELVVAAHAVIERDEGGTLQVESAWGAGDRFVEQGNWAMYFGHTIT